MKRALISILVSATMAIAPLPAMSAETGPLAPGGAAGIKQAQGDTTTPPLLLWVGAGVAVALGILVLANNNNNGGTTAPSTTAAAVTTPANPQN